ncbi:phospholipase A and acyltransferase 3-like [Biomphalaria glabrata]|uniref:Phospholipase A and acyltransferase 3-like n=1 Tax=Biomphalaria glabrata TaxID=6526 RepID=A0A9W3BA35_BIOGL|nr:phospholipase A and acyltransferase 3-like [Biomphalaria glabrata]
MASHAGCSEQRQRRNYEHNLKILEQLTPGDRVQFKRGVYSHWGVYIGDRKIVHLAGEDNDGINGNIQAKHVFTISGKTFNKARVVVDDFWDVVGEDKAFINNDRDKKWSALQPDIIVKNALEKIGQEGYNLICSNCEHFANFCRYGLSKSDQVDNFLTGAAASLATGLALAFVYALARSFKDKNRDKNVQRL